MTHETDYKKKSFIQFIVTLARFAVLYEEHKQNLVGSIGIEFSCKHKQKEESRQMWKLHFKEWFCKVFF